jgi:succinoglycan biosynthesis protein ExoA
VIQKRRAIASARHVVPPVFVGSVLAGIVLATVARRPKLLLLVAVPYATGTLLASVHAARSDRAALAALPAVFATLHVSYGAGFLAGLWRWRRSFRDWRARRA